MVFDLLVLLEKVIFQTNVTNAVVYFSFTLTSQILLNYGILLNEFYSRNLLILFSRNFWNLQANVPALVFSKPHVSGCFIISSLVFFFNRTLYLKRLFFKTSNLRSIYEKERKSYQSVENIFIFIEKRKEGSQEDTFKAAQWGWKWENKTRVQNQKRNLSISTKYVLDEKNS